MGLRAHAYTPTPWRHTIWTNLLRLAYKDVCFVKVFECTGFMPLSFPSIGGADEVVQERALF